MKNKLLVAEASVLLGALLLFAATDDARGLLIDDFSTAQTTIVSFPDASANNQASGAGILGGERDVEVTRSSAGVVLTQVGASSDKLAYGAIGGSGTGLIVWDGADADSALDPTGLGGVDFTESGLMDAISMSVLLNDFSAPLTLIAYTDGSNYSSVTLSSPGNIPPDPSTTLSVLFSDFTPVAGSGADFTNIGALSLFIDGSSTAALNLELGSIETVETPEEPTIVLVAAGVLVLAWMSNRRSGWLLRPQLRSAPRS